MNTHLSRRMTKLEARAGRLLKPLGCLVVFDDDPVPPHPEEQRVIRVRFV